MGTEQVSEQVDGSASTPVRETIVQIARRYKVLTGFILWEIMLVIGSGLFILIAPAGASGFDNLFVLISGLLMAGSLLSLLVWGPFVFGYYLYLFMKQ